MQKRAIITGGTAGLGYCSALRAAEAGFDVIIASRNQAQGELTKSEIQKKFPQVEIMFLSLDLSDMDSIDGFSRRIDQSWDLLINNAGAKIQKPFKTTKQGHEWHVGVNHLGHFALAGLLHKQVKNRVVAVSSQMHRTARISNATIDDLRDKAKGIGAYNAWSTYAVSKLANLLFIHELERRQLRNNWNIAAVAAHPGQCLCRLSPARCVQLPAQRWRLAVQLLQQQVGAYHPARAVRPSTFERCRYAGGFSGGNHAQ